MASELTLPQSTSKGPRGCRENVWLTAHHFWSVTCRWFCIALAGVFTRRTLFWLGQWDICGDEAWDVGVFAQEHDIFFPMILVSILQIDLMCDLFLHRLHHLFK